MKLGTGTEYLGFSGFRGHTEFGRELHPLIKELAPNLGGSSLRCAEIHALNQMLWEMGRYVSLPSARAALRGSIIRTARIRTPKSDNPELHKQPLTPCPTCEPLLNNLGVTYKP